MRYAENGNVITPRFFLTRERITRAALGGDIKKGNNFATSIRSPDRISVVSRISVLTTPGQTTLTRTLWCAASDLREVESYEKLPDSCRKYVDLVEQVVKRPVSIVGVGPDRKQAIFR